MNSPVTFSVERAASQGRLHLLARTFFGVLYVGIPHGLCLMLYSFWLMLAVFLAWFAVLFTGRYPRGLFNSVVGFFRWEARVAAYMYFLTDKYPAFGPGPKEGDTVKLEVAYPEKLSRLLLLAKSFFGVFYVGIPHMLCLYARMIGLFFIMIAAWFAVLFTGKYPEAMHRFAVGTLRWAMRIGMYFIQTDAYPPFTGKE